MQSRALLVLGIAVVLAAFGSWALLGTTGFVAGVAEGPAAPAPFVPGETIGAADGAGRDADAAEAPGEVGRSAVAATPPPEPGAGIVGRVVNEAGEPIAGAQVTSRAAGGFDPFTLDADELADPAAIQERLRALRSQVREATTASDGRFRIGAPGTGPTVQVRVLARGHLALERGTSRPAGGDVDLGTLTAKTGAIVSGRVLDRAGRPIASAMVSRRETRGGGLQFEGFDGFDFDFGEAGPRGDEVKTDVQGRFELAHVAPGTFALRARHEDHPPGRLEGLAVAAGETLRDVVITVDPGTTIRGRLVGVPGGTGRLRVQAATPRGDGDRAQGIIAWLGDAGELIGDGGIAERTADVGPDGAFTLRGLAVGKTYRVHATQVGRGFTGSSPCSQRVDVIAGAQDVELRYEAGATVTFAVVAAGTGQPIERLWVAERLAGGGNEGFAVTNFAADLARARTYPDGRVTLANLRPKPKQTLTLAVEALGFARFERKGIELPLVGAIDLGTLRLEPAPVVTVVARAAADGTPVAGAVVQLREQRAEESPLQFMARGAGPRSARTDAEGRAVLNGRTGARVTVRVDGPGFAPYASQEITVTEQGAEHEARLVLGGTVEVAVVEADGRPAPDTNVERAADDGARDARRSDAAGLARFERLPPGKHRFRVGGRSPRSEMAGDVVMAVRVAGAPEAGAGWTEVEVTDGGRATLRLTKAALATLSGIVRENGAALAGAQVAFIEGPGEAGGEGAAAIAGQFLEAAAGDFAGGRTRGRARTDDDGRYELRDLATGEHRLRITHRDRAMPATVRISLRAGANLFDVDLATAIVRGTVRDPSGNPIANASVTITAAVRGDAEGRMIEIVGGIPELVPGRGGRTQVKTDAQGRYELRGVEEGPHLVVRASASGFAGATSKPFTITRGSITEGVDVELPGAGAVRVRASTAAAFATVQATFAGGEGVQPVIRMLRRGEVTLEGLRPGRWQIALTVPGEAGGGTRQVDVVAGRTAEVTF